MSIWGSIGGALIGAATNALAKDQASKGVERGASVNTEAIREGAATGRADLDVALRDALADLQPLVGGGATGRQVLQREALADPNVLTPGQRKNLEDARRGARNQLATTGLRGAGRTQARILSEINDDFVNRVTEGNRSRANEAAARLHSAGVTGTTLGANATLNTGANKANIATGTGRAIGGVQGAAEQDLGNLDASSTLGTGRLFGETLGTIAGEIADERKRQSTAGKVMTGA